MDLSIESIYCIDLLLYFQNASSGIATLIHWSPCSQLWRSLRHTAGKNLDSDSDKSYLLIRVS